MLLTPIKISFYDKKTQEISVEYSQAVITFDMLFRAAGLMEVLNKPPAQRKWWMWWEPKITAEQEQINALLRLVVDFFDGQFTVEQLRKSTDVSEVMSVLRAIMSRSQNITNSNPTRPRQARERHKSKKVETGS
jgi:hypothetical protein